MGKRATDYGALVFPHIPSADAGGWISGGDLAVAAGIGERAVRLGIAQLRRTMPAEALVSSTQGYRFTLSDGEVDDFRIRQCRAAVALVETAWVGAVQPLLRATPDPLRQKLVERAFTRTLEDLGDLVNHAS